jgi:pre-mRNA-splicing factor 38A
MYIGQETEVNRQSERDRGEHAREGREEEGRREEEERKGETQGTRHRGET